jgi:hypothetical protein
MHAAFLASLKTTELKASALQIVTARMAMSHKLRMILSGDFQWLSCLL